MPDKTREALKTLSAALRKASGGDGQHLQGRRR